MNISIETRKCKNFVKEVRKVDGKVHEIFRRYTDGSGIEYEKKFCAVCGLKYTGLKYKHGYGQTITIECPVCQNNKNKPPEN